MGGDTTGNGSPCRVFDEMRPAFSISDSAGLAVVKKGRLEPVRLTLSQRTGNKKVTLVENLQNFGISPTELMQALRKMAAASATGTCIYM